MKIKEWLYVNVTSRWYKKTLSISEKPSFVFQLFLYDVYALVAIIAIAFLLGLFATGIFSSDDETEDNDKGQQVEQALNANGSQQEGLLVLSFSGSGYSASKGKGSLIAHEGTLVRVRLQNSLETFESVPVFAQVIDHSLGSDFFGAILIGSATGDSSVSRVKMSFSTLKPKSIGKTPLEFEGQALSLDGTLGIKAAKAENLLNRSVFKGGSSLLGSKIDDSGLEKQGISGMLARALIRGLQEEGGSDLGVISSNASMLTLQAGAEFYVQLTESIFRGAK